MENQIIDNAINILLPVMESAIVLAGEYSKKCGRTVLTSQDMNYTVKYCARNVTGNQMGTLFPEIDLEEDDDPTEEELETVDEEAEPFTRYAGGDNLMNAVNESYDTWESWEPQTPMEKMLKEAIDKNMY